MKKSLKITAFTLALLSAASTTIFAQAATNESPAVAETEAKAEEKIIPVTGKIKVKGKGENRTITFVAQASKRKFAVQVFDTVSLDDLAALKNKTVTLQGVIDSENLIFKVAQIGFSNTDASVEK